MSLLNKSICSVHSKNVAISNCRGLIRVAYDPRKPREPDYPKKLLLAVMEPAFRKNNEPDFVKCITQKKKFIEPQTHPYTKLQAQDCLKEIASPFVYFFHLNPVSNRNRRRLEVELQKAGIFFRDYTEEEYKVAFTGTNETNKLNFLDRFLKRNTTILLLGGIVEDHVMNKEQLNQFNSLPSIDVMRAQLCHTLSTPSISLQSSLNYHLTDLSGNLNRLADSTKNVEPPQTEPSKE